MSGLQTRTEDTINGVDVREQGSALRVATNTPHLVSLGTGRLSTAVTLHPIKQGRVTIGSDPTCDIYVVGTGVASVHCRVENSHGVVTLYPISGSTLLDGLPVDKATRLSQGSMLTIGRSNYLRFNHPEEAKLMKSVLPSGHVSMAPIQYQPNEQCMPTGYTNHQESQCYQSANIQKIYKDPILSQLDRELDLTLREVSRNRPAVPPKAPTYKESDDSDEYKSKGIMAKVSKFERYARQHCIGRSQFYTTSGSEISPKVFSANSLTVNTPAIDVLGGRSFPQHIAKSRPGAENDRFTNTTMSSDDLNRSVSSENPYGRINQSCEVNRSDRSVETSRIEHDRVVEVSRNDRENRVGNVEHSRRQHESRREQNNEREMIDASRREYYENAVESSRMDYRDQEARRQNYDEDVHSSRMDQYCDDEEYSRREQHRGISVPSSAYDRNPQYSPVYSNCPYDRNDAESMRIKAYQDRIKEEEQKEAEAARLEEILNMCAEYEKQIATGNPITPTEKRSHNKIITNGSLPRSVALNNPNFIQTSEGYYKFDTSPNRNPPNSGQRNVSSYENFDSQSPTRLDQLTPEITIGHYENVGRMDEIGIPVFDDDFSEISSPIVMGKSDRLNSSPINSPYENVYMRNNSSYTPTSLKPKSPKTQSPRTRIKTTFAHKNLPSPQYFVFPTPPPNNSEPNFDTKAKNDSDTCSPKCGGIEEQLSLEEEIPMIDDSDLTNDLECRYSNAFDKNEEEKSPTQKETEESTTIDEYLIEKTLSKNQSFDDVKNELMADIPELEEFEKDLKQNKREKIIKNITEDVKKMDFEASSIDSVGLDDVDELKSRYDNLKEGRKKLVAEIHEIKCKMSEIRSQEDDILRELEMEKALIKGEYDSEIAILNIEQRKKADLIENARKIEEEIKQLKEKQEIRQNEMRDRVEIATTKVERIEKDLKENAATLEELQNAQDILDNETKIFEDLEFQHLEEESELLANREDLQNEIMSLTKKIESQKSRILTLKSEANNNLTSALDETKILQAEYVRLLNQVETLTGKVQSIEKDLKPIVARLNDIERAQSPDSAFYTDQTRAKSGDFSPQTSDSDELDKMSGFEDHARRLNEKFNSIDRMSQSMMVDMESRFSESPKSSSSKEKKGFWERNFDSLKRKSTREKKKSPEKTDIMSQSFNENLIYNNIETDANEKFNSLRRKEKTSPVKCHSKIPTFAALGKIIKKDSFKRKPERAEDAAEVVKTRYVKNNKPVITDNKYVRAKPPTPEKRGDIKEETKEDLRAELTKSVSFGDDVTAKTERDCDDVTSKDQAIRDVTANDGIHDDISTTPGRNNDDVTSRSQSPRVAFASDVMNDAISNARDVSPNSDVIERTFASDVTIGVSSDASDVSPKQSANGKAGDVIKMAFSDVTRVLHRKSCGDEPNGVIEFQDSGKVPSQDDIDRISKVTLDAPILGSDTDMNSLGKRTLDSLMEIERKRIEMLEEQGCQVIENEREKISALKRRVQDETKRLWDQKTRMAKSMDADEDLDSNRDLDATSSTVFDESSGFLSSSIEELQVRNSRTESTEDDKRSDDSRPLSHASDFSRDNILSLSNAPRRSRRGVAPAQEWQRPLTRYLPVDRDDFDLRRHVESAGHQIELCPYVTINSSSCRGYLHKLGAKFHTWSKRWFVFDRETKTFVYYWDKSEKKPRGGAYFQVIEEVYLDHGNTSRSPSPQTTFIVKTRQRRYYLMAPSGEAARIWIDVVFTGAQGYTEYLE